MPYDGVDQDCSGADLTDVDGDGFDGSAGDDCDDGDVDVSPDGEEVPYDGVDQDCSGADLTDVDGDGFDGGGGDDCDDGDSSVHPGAVDPPDDGVDQDCDGADLSDAEALEEELAADLPSPGDGPTDFDSLGDEIRLDRVYVNLAAAGDPDIVAAAVGADVAGELPGAGWFLDITAASAADVELLLLQLEGFAEVVNASPIRRHNSGSRPSDVEDTADVSFGAWTAMEWQAAWDEIPAEFMTTSEAGFPELNTDIVVAVIDTGYDLDHPALEAAFDLPLGHDVFEGDGDPSAALTVEMIDHGCHESHGTKSAGMVGAAINGESMNGVAPGVSIIPLRVGGSGWSGAECVRSMDDDNIAVAIAVAVFRGADVISMSLSGTPQGVPNEYDNGPLRDAVIQAHAAGVVLLGAAGNDGVGQPGYPAMWPEVISVGALDATGANRAVWTSSQASNWAADGAVDGLAIAAVGTDVPAPISFWQSVSDYDEPYGDYGGTSAATPLVAGAVALALTLRPDLSTGTPATHDLILDVLRQSASTQPVNVGVDDDEPATWLSLNVLTMVEQLLSDDIDNDTFTEAQGDCNDLNPLQAPGLPDIVDGVDNDCDGLTDEGIYWVESPGPYAQDLETNARSRISLGEDGTLHAVLPDEADGSDGVSWLVDEGAGFETRPAPFGINWPAGVATDVAGTTWIAAAADNILGGESLQLWSHAPLTGVWSFEAELTVSSSSNNIDSVDVGLSAAGEPLVAAQVDNYCRLFATNGVGFGAFGMGACTEVDLAMGADGTAHVGRLTNGTLTISTATEQPAGGWTYTENEVGPAVTMAVGVSPSAFGSWPRAARTESNLLHIDRYDGAAWSTIDFPTNLTSNIPAAIAVRDDDVVCSPQLDSVFGTVAVACDDGSSTWTDTIDDPLSGHYPIGTFDDAGLLRVLTGDNYDPTLTAVAYDPDLRSAWLTDELPGLGAVDDFAVTLVDGDPWYVVKTSPSSLDRLHLVHPGGIELIAVDQDIDLTPNMLAVDATGRVHVVWRVSDHYEQIVYVSGFPNGAWAPPEILESDSNSYISYGQIDLLALASGEVALVARHHDNPCSGSVVLQVRNPTTEVWADFTLPDLGAVSKIDAASSPAGTLWVAARDCSPDVFKLFAVHPTFGPVLTYEGADEIVIDLAIDPSTSLPVALVGTSGSVQIWAWNGADWDTSDFLTGSWGSMELSIDHGSVVRVMNKESNTYTIDYLTGEVGGPYASDTVTTEYPSLNWTMLAAPGEAPMYVTADGDGVYTRTPAP